MKATWWAAAAQPVLLGFGAILTALNQNEVIDDVKPMQIRNWLPMADNEEKKGKKKRTLTNKEIIEKDDWKYD